MLPRSRCMAALSKLVGKRIKQIRESKNIKQNKLAELINVEPTNMSKIEKGVHLPKEETINKLTNALGCSVKDLFDFEHIKSREELLACINEILDNSKTEELEFFFRIMRSYKELK